MLDKLRSLRDYLNKVIESAENELAQYNIYTSVVINHNTGERLMYLFNNEDQAWDRTRESIQDIARHEYDEWVKGATTYTRVWNNSRDENRALEKLGVTVVCGPMRVEKSK